MAVEYETTPSTPGNNQPAHIFPIAGTVKKRVLKHTNQENFRQVLRLFIFYIYYLYRQFLEMEIHLKNVFGGKLSIYINEINEFPF